MTDKKDKSLIIHEKSTELALGKTGNMLAITKKILGNAPAVRKAAPPTETKPAQTSDLAHSTAIAPYGNKFRDEITGMEFVWIPAGSFEMGDDEYSDELPVHTVHLQGFYLGKYAVTQGEWMKIMGENPSYFDKGSRYPVEEVSWDDAQEFIAKLNARSGKTYSLPSEAQWEYAARECGKRVRFGNGKDIIDPKEANFDGSEECKQSYSRAGEYRRTTVPVDSFASNALGLYNMSGNVWEWCQDRWHENYEGAPTDGSAWEDGEGTNRVIRGGGWNGIPWGLRAAFRYWDRAGDRGSYRGLRLSLVQQ